MVAVMAAATLAFVGCKKEETPGEKLDAAVKSVEKGVDKAVKSAEKGAEKVAKDAEKGAEDLQKKLDGALKK
jgi:vacuolar-type H+-ATPase subunit H